MAEFKFFAVLENSSSITNDLTADELVVLVIGTYHWCIALTNWLDWPATAANDAGTHRSHCGGC